MEEWRSGEERAQRWGEGRRHSGESIMARPKLDAKTACGGEGAIRTRCDA